MRKRAAAFANARREVRNNRRNFAKKAIDGGESRPYMALTGGALLCALPRLRLLTIANPVAPDQGDGDVSAL
jgi:hypothetical protein